MRDLLSDISNRDLARDTPICRPFFAMALLCPEKFLLTVHIRLTFLPYNFQEIFSVYLHHGEKCDIIYNVFSFFLLRRATVEDISLLSPLKGISCAVLGIGISNLPLIDTLLSEGAAVTARDQKCREELGKTADALEARGVRLILGKSYLQNLTESVIFRSPGIRPDVPEIAAAVADGATLTSEMELFFIRKKIPVFAITGSDGKTTTTNLTYQLLKRQFEHDGAARRVLMGGNVGTPLLPRIAEMSEDDIAVAELSSFQLFTMKQSATRAVITNITPNHLNWHPDMAEYTAAKCNIYAHGETEHLTLNADNEITAQLAERIVAQSDLPLTLFSSTKHSYGEIFPTRREGCTAMFTVFENDEEIIVFSDGEYDFPILPVSRILLPGRHNVENYMAAISLTRGWITPEVIEEVASTFPGVEHRLETVRVLHGVTYYNSSIDSSPTRTAAALSALTVRPIVICGGYDKNIPFAPLAESLCARARAVVLTGATAEKIREALLACPAYRPDALPILLEPEFDRAVMAAHAMAKSGDAVLLSPACASFDAFPNFEVRGNRFKQLIRALPE
jgi:UDP-N-acetylmuramoylalanine--D-glutamate ligase